MMQGSGSVLAHDPPPQDGNAVERLKKVESSRNFKRIFREVNTWNSVITIMHTSTDEYTHATLSHAHKETPEDTHSHTHTSKHTQTNTNTSTRTHKRLCLQISQRSSSQASSHLDNRPMPLYAPPPLPFPLQPRPAHTPAHLHQGSINYTRQKQHDGAKTT